MAQAMIDLIGATIPEIQISSGNAEPRAQKTFLDLNSGVHYLTCNKPFTTVLSTSRNSYAPN